MNKPNVLNNERGGVSVMVASLIAMIFCILIMVIAVDYALLVSKQKKIKNDLNAAVHAASLSIDKTQLSKGFLRLDTTTSGKRAQDMFYTYLRKNMKLDNNNRAEEGSVLKQGTQVNIEELVYVDYESRSVVNLNTRPTSCALNTSNQVICSVTIHQGTSKEITRDIRQTVIGPSIVAIISAPYEGIGLLGDEPLLIPALQEVIFRK